MTAGLWVALKAAVWAVATVVYWADLLAFCLVGSSVGARVFEWAGMMAFSTAALLGWWVVKSAVWWVVCLVALMAGPLENAYSPSAFP